MCSIHNIHGIEKSKDLSNTQTVHDMLEQQSKVIGAQKHEHLCGLHGGMFSEEVWTGNTKNKKASDFLTVNLEPSYVQSAITSYW